MKLFLVQHGKAKRKEEDPDRPLNYIGVEETTKVAKYISELNDIQLKVIIHSGKTRARQTAEIFGKHLNISDNIEPGANMAPNDEPDIWVEKLENQNDNIMLVGHLPHLAKLTAKLLSGNENKPVVKFRNSGVVCLEKNEDLTWSLYWLLVPENIK
jgi:phosphohistidine phosphatase